MCSGKKEGKKKKKKKSTTEQADARKNQAVCKPMYTSQERARCGKRKKKKKGNDDALAFKAHTHTHIYHERAPNIYFFSYYYYYPAEVLLFLFFLLSIGWCSVDSSSPLSFPLAVGLILDRNEGYE